jgi:hypothetical protein
MSAATRQTAGETSSALSGTFHDARARDATASVAAAATVADVYLHRPKAPEPPKPKIELPPGAKRD